MKGWSGRFGKALTNAVRICNMSKVLDRDKMTISREDIKAMSTEEIRQAFLDLQAHQTELELQNQKLRRTREKLEVSRERYFELFDLAPVGYITVNVRGLILETNLAAARMLGTTKNRLVKKPFSRFIYRKDQNVYYVHRKKLFKTRLLREALGCELRMVKTDDTAFWASLEATAIRDADGSIICRVVINDIDKQKQDEERIVRMNARLQKAVAERDKFFSIIAHDLRSPFIGFLTFIRMLTERIEKLSLNEIQRLANNMKHSAENLYNLLENLLEWSLVQRGSANYSPVPCCLENMVRGNFDLMQTVALQKNVEFRCSISGDLRVLADKSMLNMILRNLLSNAVKFSRKNGVVEISAKPGDCMLQISVADDGIGMDNEALEKLFALDRMSSRKGTAGEKGTGLGLLLCREYVRRHGGEIWVRSRPGKGTVFYFTLPVGSTDNPGRST